MNLNEWEEELKMDAAAEAHEQMQDAKLEYKLSKDYDFFVKYHEYDFQAAIDAIKALKDKHEMYNQDFDVRELV